MVRNTPKTLEAMIEEAQKHIMAKVLSFQKTTKRQETNKGFSVKEWVPLKEPKK